MANTAHSGAGIFGGSAPLNSPDGDMLPIPAAWLDPLVTAPDYPWLKREVVNGAVVMSVAFPGHAFRRLTLDSLDKVISSTDRAIFLKAYPELFAEPVPVMPVLPENLPSPVAPEPIDFGGV